MPKKKSVGRPKKRKTKVVSFRAAVEDYKKVQRHEGKKPEQLAKEDFESRLVKAQLSKTEEFENTGKI